MRVKKNKKKMEIIKHIKENSDNKEVIKNCVYLYPECLEYIRKELLLDKEFCKELLNINGMTLFYMLEEIKKDKELVLIAIDKSAGFALKFADDSLKKDFEVVKRAILKYKEPLKFASEDLQIYFKNKWEEYFKKHIYEEWTGFEISYNDIRNTEEEMQKINEKENNKKKKKEAKEKVNKELETLKECLEEMQISFNEYDFEEND